MFSYGEVRVLVEVRPSVFLLKSSTHFCVHKNTDNPILWEEETMTDLRQEMNASIECNNIGVSLLKAGLLSESLESFEAAAQLMHTLSQSIKPSLIPTVSVSSPESASSQLMVNESERMVKMAKCRTFLMSASNSSSQCITTNDCFVSADPFTIDLIQYTPLSCRVESATIVYNIGLTYHRYGSLSHLERALCLFDMAFSLAFSTGHDSRSPIIAMRALNNAGQIHHSLSNYAVSRKYLDTLSSYILSLPFTSDEATRKERRHFLLNAVMLQEPKIAGAA
jgi:hypothetical protein